MMTGSGGWPLSVFLTPEGKPFYGGTYMPKEQFLAVMKQIVNMKDSNPDQLEQMGNELYSLISAELKPAPGKAIGMDEITKVIFLQ